MKVKCPKCGEDAVKYSCTSMEGLYYCKSSKCSALFTDWQQWKIEMLKAENEVLRSCKQETDAGDGPCGVCRDCLREKIEEQAQELARLKAKVKDSCWEQPCHLIIQVNARVVELEARLKESDRQLVGFKDQYNISGSVITDLRQRLKDTEAILLPYYTHYEDAEPCDLQCKKKYPDNETYWCINCQVNAYFERQGR